MIKYRCDVEFKSVSFTGILESDTVYRSKYYQHPHLAYRRARDFLDRVRFRDPVKFKKYFLCYYRSSDGDYFLDRIIMLPVGFIYRSRGISESVHRSIIDVDSVFSKNFIV